MARETLPVALTLTFGDEGGYSNAPTDRGNYLNGVLVGTKYGITGATLAAHRGVKTVSAAQVRAMSRQEAEDIYRRSYWSQAGGDILPPGLDYAAFDFGVNSGPTTAVKKLQTVLAGKGLYTGKIDGHIGEQTIAAVSAYPGGVRVLIVDYCEERMRYLRSLTNAKTGFPKNGRGWTIRITGKDPKGQWKNQPGVVGNALRLAAAKAPVESQTTSGSAKADGRDTGVGEVLKKPEAWGPLGGLVSAIGAIAAGSGPVQCALAVVVVAGVAYGIYRLVKRERANA